MRHAMPRLLIAALMLLSAGTAFAQARLASATRMYDPKTVETVTGTVVKVHEAGSHKGGGGIHGAAGVHLLLKTGTGEIPVRLGPAWYVDKQPVKIAVHDAIEVRGSRITYAGKPAIVAAEVKKGNHVMKLRRDDGVPLWHVQGRRAG